MLGCPRLCIGEIPNRATVKNGQTAFCFSAKPMILAIAHLDCKLSNSCRKRLRFSDEHMKDVKIVFCDYSMRFGRKQPPSQDKAVTILPDASA